MVGCLPSMRQEERWGREKRREGRRQGRRKETICEMKEREMDRKGGLFPSAHSQERASVNLSNLNTHLLPPPLRILGGTENQPCGFYSLSFSLLCPGLHPHRQAQKERSYQLLSFELV